MQLLFIFKYLNRINRMNYLITLKSTGSPDEFSQRLNISKRQLYNDLEMLREIGAEIKYDRCRGSYYYENSFDIDIEININR